MLIKVIKKLVDGLYPEIPSSEELTESTDRCIRETEEMMREYARRNNEFANAVREKYGKLFEQGPDW